MNPFNAEDVLGTFSHLQPSVTPSAGEVIAGVRFTPVDTDNYETVSGLVDVQVNRALAQVVWPTATPITYPEAYGATSLSGGGATNPYTGGNVLGEFRVNTPDTVVNAGTYAIG